MTPEPTEAQIKEARRFFHFGTIDELAAYIAQRDTERAEHEAFRQRVSEFARRVCGLGVWINEDLRDAAETFIQPDPTPTPEQVLAEAIKACGIWDSGETLNTRLVGALAKRDHHVAPIKDTRHD